MYVTNCDECEWIETNSIALYMNGDNLRYFDSFGVEYIPKHFYKFKKYR